MNKNENNKKIKLILENLKYLEQSELISMMSYIGEYLLSSYSLKKYVEEKLLKPTDEVCNERSKNEY